MGTSQSSLQHPSNVSLNHSNQPNGERQRTESEESYREGRISAFDGTSVKQVQPAPLIMCTPNPITEGMKMHDSDKLLLTSQLAALSIHLEGLRSHPSEFANHNGADMQYHSMAIKTHEVLTPNPKGAEILVNSEKIFTRLHEIRDDTPESERFVEVETKLTLPVRQSGKIDTSLQQNPITQDRKGIRRKPPIKDNATTVDHRFQKSNSCSTLFVDSTLVNSDLHITLQCMSSYLFQIIVRHRATDKMVLKDIYSERMHPLSSQVKFYKRKASEGEFFKFLDFAFASAEIKSICAIVSLAYLDRLLDNSKITFHESNWVRLVLGTLILASKVWDDHAVWNVDFCRIFPDVHVADFNDLERDVLESISFDISIKSSTYAKYYFVLRDIAESKGRPWPEKPLTLKDVDKLELKQDESQSNSDSDSIVESPLEDSMYLSRGSKQVERFLLANPARKLSKSASCASVIRPAKPFLAVDQTAHPSKDHL